MDESLELKQIASGHTSGKSRKLGFTLRLSDAIVWAVSGTPNSYVQCLI